MQWSAETGEHLGDSRIEMGRGWHHLANGAVVCLCLAGMMEIGEGSYLDLDSFCEHIMFG